MKNTENFHHISVEIKKKFRVADNHVINISKLEENVLFFYPYFLILPKSENTLGYIMIDVFLTNSEELKCFWDIKQKTYCKAHGYILISRYGLIGSYFPEVRSLYLTDWTHSLQGAKVANKLIPWILEHKWESATFLQKEKFKLDTTVSYNISNIVEILDCAKTFYALDWAEMVLSRTQTDSVGVIENKRLGILGNDIQIYGEKFHGLFAKCIRDYLLLSACGEARHGRLSCEKNSLMFLEGQRSSVYSYITKYDMEQLINLLQRLFQISWKAGYGGEKWFKIVSQVENYERLSPKIFIDQSLSIAHNGGYAYDKGVVFGCPSPELFMNFLSFKKLNSLNEGNIKENILQVDGQAHSLITRLNSLVEEKWRLKTTPSETNLVKKLEEVQVNWGKENVCLILINLNDSDFMDIFKSSGILFSEDVPTYKIGGLKC